MQQGVLSDEHWDSQGSVLLKLKRPRLGSRLAQLKSVRMIEMPAATTGCSCSGVPWVCMMTPMLVLASGPALPAALPAAPVPLTAAAAESASSGAADAIAQRIAEM